MDASLQKETPFEKVVRLLDGQSNTARLLTNYLQRQGIDKTIYQSHVGKWLNETLNGVPPEYCIPFEIMIEMLTDQRVTRYELRPDVFGAPPQQNGKRTEQAA
jgi:Bacterial toxin YdaS